jgi:hypothetical protein
MTYERGVVRELKKPLGSHDLEAFRDGVKEALKRYEMSDAEKKGIISGLDQIIIGDDRSPPRTVAELRERLVQLAPQSPAARAAYLDGMEAMDHSRVTKHYKETSPYRS